MNGRQRLRTHLAPCRTAAEVMAILGGEIRFDFTRTLARGARTVTSLADELGLRMPLASKNLAILREHSLVRYERIRNERFYMLSEHVQCSIADDVVQFHVPTTHGDLVTVLSHMPPSVRDGR